MSRRRTIGSLITLSLLATGLAVGGGVLRANAAFQFTTSGTHRVQPWVHDILADVRSASGQYPPSNTIEGTGGAGRRIVARFPVAPNDTLTVGVAQGAGAAGAASPADGDAGGAGGGASYVKCGSFQCGNDLAPMVVAGGGGGGGGVGTADGEPGAGGNAGSFCPPHAPDGTKGGVSTDIPVAIGGNAGLGGGHPVGAADVPSEPQGTDNTDCARGGKGGAGAPITGGVLTTAGTAGSPNNGTIGAGGAGGGGNALGGGGGGGGAGFVGGGGAASGALGGPGGGGGGGTSYIDPGATLLGTTALDATPRALVPDADGDVPFRGTPLVRFGYRPAAPSSVNAEAGAGSATVAWSITDQGGFLTVDFFNITCLRGDTNPPTEVPCAVVGGPNLPGTARTATITGLSPGIPYSFVVIAHNLMGFSDPSAPSNVVFPTGAPGSPSDPQNIVATATDGEATVSWSPPASDGGSPIAQYVVTAYFANFTPAGQSQTVFCSITSCTGRMSVTFTGLTNGVTYIFGVKAKNNAGVDGSEAFSNPVTPRAAFAAEHFDSPTTNWAITSSGGSTVKWHITSACGANHTAGGGFGAYFGIDSTCTYADNTAPFGDITSPVVTVRSPQSATTAMPLTLTLWSKRKVETCATTCNRDQTIISVNYGDGVWRQIYYKDADDPSPATPTWEQLTFNLSLPITRTTFQVRMTFTSTSSVNNGFYGWAFDDLLLFTS